VDGEGGSSSGDYRAYKGNGAASPALLSFANSGMAASGAANDDNGDNFFHSLFPSPAYETAGSPGKHWVQVELSQINGVLTWQMDGVVVAQRTNTTAYTAGDIMIGYMDPYTSIANPAADNFVLFDNVRVLIAAQAAAVSNLTVIPRPRSALVSWSSGVPSIGQIEYGIAPGYGSYSTTEPSSRTSHTILLNGLTPNTNYVLLVHSQIGVNQIVSGPFTFSTDVSLIVDNPQATYSGNWTIGTSSPDQYGGYFQYASTTTAGSPSAQANYSPTIITPGKYDVFIWYAQGENRTVSAPVQIFGSSSYAGNTIDETSGGGIWRLVAPAFGFAPGSLGLATIGNNTGEADRIVVADAFRWVYTASQDVPTDGSVPEWWSNYYFGTAVDPSLDPDNDGYSTAAEYVLGTDPANAVSKFSVSSARKPNGLDISFLPAVGGRVYELQLKTNLSSTLWQTMLDVPALANGQGKFSVTNAPSAPSRFFRIAVHLLP
jgi:hypothetical protein